MSEINPHPALKAAVPQSPMVDGWMGDDWFHNGAFRTGSLDFAVVAEHRQGRRRRGSRSAPGDDYTRYLEAGSMADYAPQLGHRQVPVRPEAVPEPGLHRILVGLQAVDKWMAARPLTVPTMLEVGQWDQEDSYGAPAVYSALKDKYEGTDLLHLVIGPWRHSGANHYGYDLGDLTFTGDTAREWRAKYMKPFFDHYLKGAPDPHTPPVLTYATGINQWEEKPALADGHADAALPHGEQRCRLRPSGDRRPRRLCVRPGQARCRSCRGRSTGRSDQWHSWLVHDQRFVDGRPDVLSYTTAPLDQAGAHHGGAAGRPVRRRPAAPTATGSSS